MENIGIFLLSIFFFIVAYTVIIALITKGRFFIKIVGETFFSIGIGFMVGAAISFSINQTNYFIFLIGGGILFFFGSLLRLANKMI